MPDSYLRVSACKMRAQQIAGERGIKCDHHECDASNHAGDPDTHVGTSTSVSIAWAPSPPPPAWQDINLQQRDPGGTVSGTPTSFTAHRLTARTTLVYGGCLTSAQNNRPPAPALIVHAFGSKKDLISPSEAQSRERDIHSARAGWRACSMRRMILRHKRSSVR